MNGDCGIVVIADHDASERALVSGFLARAGIAAREAASGDEALAALREERPALVLAEVELPDVSGYEVCRLVKEEHGERVPVILVSATRTEPYDRAAGLLLGADDYVVKPFDVGELSARVRRCIERAAESWNGRENGARDPGYGLSARELEVLGLLAAGYGTAAIANRLVISRKTVATHVQRTLSKLSVHSRTAAVAVAHREGLVADVEAHRATRSM